MLPFAEARAAIRRLKLPGSARTVAWREYCKSGQRPANIPANPRECYTNEGWTSMEDWMGPCTAKMAEQAKRTSGRKQARQSASGTSGASGASSASSASRGSRGSRGSSREWLPFEKARAIVWELKLRGTREWVEWFKSGSRRADIPGNPAVAYRDEGFVSYPDWLGCGADGGGRGR